MDLNNEYKVEKGVVRVTISGSIVLFSLWSELGWQGLHINQTQLLEIGRMLVKAGLDQSTDLATELLGEPTPSEQS
jgi:hypothetical protein